MLNSGLSEGEGRLNVALAATVAEFLRILAMASDRYPILERFNVFDRHDVPAKERPARRQAFREQMRGDVLRRIG